MLEFLEGLDVATVDGDDRPGGVDGDGHDMRPHRREMTADQRRLAKVQAVMAQIQEEVKKHDSLADQAAETLEILLEQLTQERILLNLAEGRPADARKGKADSATSKRMGI